jgi:glycosyltransferase involved in cell wall biosynthesis
VLTQKKLIFWVESTAYEAFRSWPKERFKKFLLRSAAGCIVPGKRSLEYCRKLGMSEDRIFFTPNSVDRDYFRNQAEKLFPSKNTLRESANLKGFVILFVGRLVESAKGVSTLIKACGELERKGRKIALLLAGDGPDGGPYRELVRSEGLTDVRFLGFLNYEVLCQYYAMAHVLVLPSYSEPWGLVLNEGMEFGLPLVVSEAVGAGPDLVDPGKNGFVIPTGNASALAQVLEKLVEDENLRSKMGEASQSIIQNFSPENWANGVIKAINTVCG